MRAGAAARAPHQPGGAHARHVGTSRGLGAHPGCASRLLDDGGVGHHVGPALVRRGDIARDIRPPAPLDPGVVVQIQFVRHNGKGRGVDHRFVALRHAQGAEPLVLRRILRGGGGKGVPMRGGGKMEDRALVDRGVCGGAFDGLARQAIGHRIVAPQGHAVLVVEGRRLQAVPYAGRKASLHDSSCGTLGEPLVAQVPSVPSRAEARAGAPLLAPIVPDLGLALQAEAAQRMPRSAPARAARVPRYRTRVVCRTGVMCHTRRQDKAASVRARTSVRMLQSIGGSLRLPLLQNGA